MDPLITSVSTVSISNSVFHFLEKDSHGFVPTLAINLPAVAIINNATALEIKTSKHSWLFSELNCYNGVHTFKVLDMVLPHFYLEKFLLSSIQLCYKHFKFSIP